MQIIREIAAMSKWSGAAAREGLRIGFVPTMGCLHEGHISLVRRASEMSDRVVLSIFVNPIQFGKGDDFDRYPRDFDRDRRLCEAEGVDVLFHPREAEMYRPDASTFVEETSLSSGLCGKFRPGHFRGVTTVVAKLFNIVRPDVAVFGEKDAQQAAVIRRMAKDLDYPVEVVTAPTVREPDGLAMSSRNIRLSPAERGAAGALSRALSAAAAAFAAGERSSSSLRAGILSRLKSNSLLVPEYVEIVDGETLRETESVKPGTLIALAVHCGGTRLIDNIVLGRDPAGTGSI